MFIACFKSIYIALYKNRTGDKPMLVFRIFLTNLKVVYCKTLVGLLWQCSHKPVYHQLIHTVHNRKHFRYQVL